MTEEEKITVLENLRSISAEDLYKKYIKPGHILLSKMQDTGDLSYEKRQEIIEMMARDKAREDNDWANIQSHSTLEGCRSFLYNYPNSERKKAVEDILDKLKQQEFAEIKNKKLLLDRLRSNPNGDFHPKIINDLLNKGTLNISDLIEVGIPQDVIDVLPGFREPGLTLGDIPDAIPEGYTEVYFWGIPGSGKTCALSGILGYAREAGVLDTASGPGFHYMTQLKNIFRSRIGFLPAATSTEATQCLPFELRDGRGKKHPIALVELSGEIFRCYYYKLAGLPFPDEDHVRTFNTVTSYLNSKNKKIHFFVFDVSKVHLKNDRHGLAQDDYLNAAQTYFKQYNIFKNYTDAIYLIATKSDILGKEKREEKASEHLKNNYPDFIEVLKDACKKYKINDNSNLRVLPFSLGDVYFNSICRFNNASSAEIINILKTKTGVARGNSRLGDFFNR
jgi:hypothetical protein